MDPHLFHIRKRIRELSKRLPLSAEEEDELDQMQAEVRRAQKPAPAELSVKDNVGPSVPLAQGTNVVFPDNDPPARRKPKGKKKLGKYQQHIKECRTGRGAFESQGVRQFDECVALWREIKASGKH